MITLTTFEGRRTPGVAMTAPGNSDLFITFHGRCVCHETLSGQTEHTHYVDAVELHGLNLKKMFKIKPARFKFKMKPNFGKMFKIKPGRFKIKARLNLGSIGKKIGSQFDKLFNTRGVSRFMKRNLDLGKFASRMSKPVGEFLQSGVEMTAGLVDKLIPGAGSILGDAGQEAIEQGEQFVQDEAANIQQEADAAIDEALASVDGLLQQFMEPVAPPAPGPELPPMVTPVLPANRQQPRPAPVPQIVRRTTGGMDTTTMMLIGGGALALMVLSGGVSKSGRRRAA